MNVLALDFGRAGLAICYDIGWPSLWDELAARGAELVVRPPAYDGGFPLQSYAWRNSYCVVSSVWGFQARIIHVTGHFLAATSRFSRIAAAEIDLEKQVFHTDQNAAKLLALTTRYGRRVSLETFTEEHVFTLQSNDPARTVEDIAREFGLEPFRGYQARAERIQDETRAASKVPV